MKHITATILLFVTIQTCNGQTEIKQDYSELFKTADSINKLSNVFTIDHTLTHKLSKLDKLLPSDYFTESIHLYEANKFEDASVVYYIGFLRHKYCCNADPSYAPNYDWSVAESMQATYGKKIILFLKTNIDRYIYVINSATEYCQKNDYLFFPKQKNIEKYNSSINALINLKSDYLKNKDAYVKQWTAERISLLMESK